jgi:hypothetical protein
VGKASNATFCKQHLVACSAPSGVVRSAWRSSGPLGGHPARNSAPICVPTLITLTVKNGEDLDERQAVPHPLAQTPDAPSP